METVQTFLLAFLGGLLPAIVWLSFWLREDDDHPEPNAYIILSFILGMCAVPGAFLGQQLVQYIGFRDIDIAQAVQVTPYVALTMLFIWSCIEEVLKYIAAYHGGLKHKTNDEPIDDVVYMITAALGFAALENTLFLLGPLLDGNTTVALATGNMRFIGATLLHVAMASIIGIFRAYGHFKPADRRRLYTWIGIILATALHAYFNFFIMTHVKEMFFAFSTLWILIVAIIFIFEKIKSIHLESIQ